MRLPASAGLRSRCRPRRKRRGARSIRAERPHSPHYACLLALRRANQAHDARLPWSKAKESKCA
ncbi:MAG: hypothetical protein GEU92_21000 [Alphaproteobacteria bacterium]|nr:hypothetical protein [Alphaproteobacteria bacterium]